MNKHAFQTDNKVRAMPLRGPWIGQSTPGSQEIFNFHGRRIFPTWKLFRFFWPPAQPKNAQKQLGLWPLITEATTWWKADGTIFHDVTLTHLYASIYYAWKEANYYLVVRAKRFGTLSVLKHLRIGFHAGGAQSFDHRPKQSKIGNIKHVQLFGSDRPRHWSARIVYVVLTKAELAIWGGGKDRKSCLGPARSQASDGFVAKKNQC